MKSFHWALLSLLLASGTAAATTTVGPLLDYDQSVPSTSNGTIVIHTHFDLDIGPLHIHEKDKIVGWVPWTTANVRALAYVTTDTGGTGGDALVTTIYGQAYTPVGSGLDTTGFNALSPEMTPVSGETIIGDSGTEYQSSWSSGATALSELSSLPQLQGFDLSPFQGDPSSVVYAFQTDVPVSDLYAPVPEPLTMTLVGMGIAGLGGYIRRRRMAAKQPSEQVCIRD